MRQRVRDARYTHTLTYSDRGGRRGRCGSGDSAQRHRVRQRDRQSETERHRERERERERQRERDARQRRPLGQGTALSGVPLRARSRQCRARIGSETGGRSDQWASAERVCLWEPNATVLSQHCLTTLSVSLSLSLSLSASLFLCLSLLLPASLFHSFLLSLSLRFCPSPVLSVPQLLQYSTALYRTHCKPVSSSIAPSPAICTTL